MPDQNSMEENSFIPLTEADMQQSRRSQSPGRKNQVFKKGSITKGKAKIIDHNNHHESTGMQCTPVLEDGKVIAIDVRCGCGTTQRIHLEYDETI